MAGFGTAVNRPLYGRGPSPGLRFTGYALLALTIMYFDQRGQLSERLRYGLQAIAYPIQLMVSSPGSLWRGLSSTFQTRSSLRDENVALKARTRELELAAMRELALEQENAQLRDLHQALPPLVKRWQLAEVVSIETTPLRQRLVINRGKHDGAFINEAVIDDHGILGQIARVGPFSSEVILITDPEHAISVQVVRNNLRTVAIGSGNSGELLLRDLAVNSDVKSGDLLVSSGLGGVFPAGYPVAQIIGVRREANQLLAQVRAAPLAQVERAREVMLIEFDPTHPAAPAPNPPIAPPAAPANAKHPVPVEAED
ncbi:MAG: rod shape-determining protein MreC [Steroidobacteraceae bacterium]